MNRRLFSKGLLFFALVAPFFTVVSQAASLTPPKPVASQAKYSGYVRVSWSKVSNSKGYVIRRGITTSFNSSEIIAIIRSGSTKSYKDKGAAIGKVYYYWVCPMSSSTKYVYNSSRYSKGYRKLKSAWGEISGPSSLKKGQSALYYLYVDGKKITSNSVQWTVSGSRSSLVDVGYYADMFSVGSSAVTVKAKYLGKTFKKKVAISGQYAVPNCSVITRTCYKHGAYRISSCSVGGCPTCLGEIDLW